jgi:phage terminase large subunit
MMDKIQTTRVFSEIESAKKKGYTTVSEQGSSRSSKTYNTLIWLCVYCLQHPCTSVSIVRATLPSIKGSVLRDFVQIMQRMKVWDGCKFNKSDLVCTFPNGSWVEFFSCDNEQKLRGRKRKILYVNEGNELNYISWQQLQMRTTEFSIIDYNPSFTDDHWLCGLNKEPKTYHFITTYKDNPFLEAKVIEEIESLKEKNPSLWRIYGLGLQAMVEGLVFENVEVIKEIPRWQRKHHYRGVDFGYSNDPTAIVDVYINGDTILLDEICYQTEMLSTDIVRTLKEANSECGENVETISESADPRLIDEIGNAGIDIRPVRKFKGSIAAGIQKMQELKIKVTERSTNVIKEFRNYTYRQNREGKWLNEPIDAYNHAIDAIRYVCLEKLLGQNSDSLSATEFLDLI